MKELRITPLQRLESPDGWQEARFMGRQDRSKDWVAFIDPATGDWVLQYEEYPNS